jgi:hypothetical protein
LSRDKPSSAEQRKQTDVPERYDVTITSRESG